MRQQGKYLLGTPEEIVAHLVKDSFDNDGYLKESASFIECDFAIADESYMNSKDLEEIQMNSDGWYGIKQIDTEFYSDCLDLISDYYGGGCAHLCSVIPGENKNSVISYVKNTIIDTLNCIASCDNETLLIGVINKLKFYFTFGSDALFPYQNGYIIIISDTLNNAIKKFRSKFPDRHLNTVNCSFWYTEEQWKETTMATNDDYKCYEVIE